MSKRLFRLDDLRKELTDKGNEVSTKEKELNNQLAKQQGEIEKLQDFLASKETGLLDENKKFDTIVAEKREKENELLSNIANLEATYANECNLLKQMQERKASLLMAKNQKEVVMAQLADSIKDYEAKLKDTISKRTANEDLTARKHDNLTSTESKFKAEMAERDAKIQDTRDVLAALKRTNIEERDRIEVQHNLLKTKRDLSAEAVANVRKQYLEMYKDRFARIHEFYQEYLKLIEEGQVVKFSAEMKQRVLESVLKMIEETLAAINQPIAFESMKKYATQEKFLIRKFMQEKEIYKSLAVEVNKLIDEAKKASEKAAEFSDQAVTQMQNLKEDYLSRAHNTMDSRLDPIIIEEFAELAKKYKLQESFEQQLSKILEGIIKYDSKLSKSIPDLLSLNKDTFNDMDPTIKGSELVGNYASKNAADEGYNLEMANTKSSRVHSIKSLFENPKILQPIDVSNLKEKRLETKKQVIEDWRNKVQDNKENIIEDKLVFDVKAEFFLVERNE